MYDQLGNKYLDCINNVAHGISYSSCFFLTQFVFHSVGHCHPYVNKQIYRQMGACATNNRYLHDNTVILAEKLTKTLPKELEQIFYTNSA
jgi:ethanolamine-phosphate phospho-lyase